MKSAPIPINERERLKELLSYEVLDTEAELCFDELTELASHICETPIALVSLVDDNRQWFKSRYGLEASETPRDISFCGHAIHQEEVFVIPNSLEDERFFDNPLVVGEPKVIFYAGYPLLTESGHKLGTLCVIDHEPRKLSDSQRRSLEILGRQVISQLELRRRNIELNKSCQKIVEQAKELEEHQAMAIENAKMSSLGVMAGGISHEINNPLGIISLLSLQIKTYVQKSDIDVDKISKFCDNIDETVTRISRIIKGLRSIARDVSNDPMKNEPLSEIIENSLSVCREKFKSSGIDITIEGELDQEVFCRGGQISQVLINLLSNSADAVEELVEKWVRVEVSSLDEQLCISVIDSGNALSSESSLNIMEPFVTTKPVGKGTGLGLSISRGLIESHEGELKIDLHCKNSKIDILIPTPRAQKQQKAS